MNRTSLLVRAAFATVVPLLLLMLLESTASAIPAFARQYGRDCQTCHVAFPKLTPFGEAFRRSGYRYPGGHDEDFLAAEPVFLGREQYKKLFPHTVWPGSLPSRVQLAAQIALRADYVRDQEPELSFANLGGGLTLNLATNFDQTFSAWAGVKFQSTTTGSVETEMERIFGVIKPFDDPIVTFRIGHFDPELWGFSNHRTLGFAPWLMVTPVLDNPFTPHPAQNGIEAQGVVGAGRLTYSVGVVEGGGDRVNNFKDVYSRLAYKFGGMRLDGLEVSSQSAQPWREKSLQIGAFGYFGQSALGDPEVASQEDRFVIAGGDANILWRDFNLILAGGVGRNQRPSLIEPNEQANSLHTMGQLDIVVYPWLIPTLRYERREIAGVVGQRASGGVYFLLRANVRTQILASAEGDADALDNQRVLAGLNIVL
ncbi:MAG TPA: hypothetical protein PKA88_18165 [Polyangiaceae bacterium]|nr:hypothetical protein [Polyangiaceae bacterium]HMR78967.1 hypothetical protein [Polyangiaceae bacterium]